MNEQAIFIAALQRDPGEISAFLDEACGGDATLRQRVEKLLAAHAKAGSFLDDPAMEDPRQGDPRKFDPASAATGEFTPHPEPETAQQGGREADVGTVLDGKYKLIEAIGEGGMGNVFMAQQTHPVKRAVAVKVIKAGMDSKAVLARFEAERQALAMMDHPNIARVLDAGTTDAGRPYFVMELVKGVPITQYCDDHRLTPRQRLELFVPVCHAIQHAHQKGIIHRDIKPSNVLVAMFDDRPVPKVIDFGVAKAAGQSLTDMTLMTGFGAVVGTPEYMSPEQANLNNMDIDTRSDVYSLGVLLYELLTGSTPVDRKSLGKAAVLEILRIVREVDAPKPSHKLSTIETLAKVAACRNTEPAKLSRLLKGELDWVLLKSLEKDRGRRYDTANALARDIQRYLADEVVEARPPSSGYRLRKLIRRNKGQMLAASLFAFALLAGITGTTIGLFEAKRQKNLADKRADGEKAAKLEAQENEKRAIQAAEAEKAAKGEADTKRKYAESSLAVGMKLLEVLMAVLADVNPQTKQTTLAELRMALRNGLAKAAKDIDNSDVNLQLNLKANVLFAEIRHSLALALSNMGDDDLAIELYQKAIAAVEEGRGKDDPRVIVFISNLARAYQNKGDLAKAMPLYERAAKEAKNAFAATSNLANGYMGMGRYAEALPLLEKVLEAKRNAVGPEGKDTVTAMHDLSFALRNLNELDRAIPLAREAFQTAAAKFGRSQFLTLCCMANLAECLLLHGDLDEAAPLLEEAIKLWTSTQGTDSPRYFQMMNNLGALYYNQARLDKSVPLYETLQKLSAQKLGADHPDAQHAAANLAMNYQRAGRHAEALPFLEATQQLSRRKPEFRFVTPALLDVYGQLGKTAEARKLVEVELAQLDKQYPKNSPQRATPLAQMGAAMLAPDLFAAAEPLLRECLEIRQKTQPDAWTTFSTLSMLGGSLLGQKKYGEAEPLLLMGYAGLKAREKSIPANARHRFIESMQRLIDLYTALEKPDEVKKWKAELAKQSEAPPKPAVKK